MYRKWVEHVAMKSLELNLNPIPNPGLHKWVEHVTIFLEFMSRGRAAVVMMGFDSKAMKEAVSKWVAMIATYARREAGRRREGCYAGGGKEAMSARQQERGAEWQGGGRNGGIGRQPL